MMTEKQRQELCERFSQIYAVANPNPNVPFEKFIYDALLKAFIAGAEYAWNNPNWISVEDELPKNDGGFSDIVLVCTKDKRYYTAQFNYISNCWMAECSDDEITHWMQIVPPRKEK